MYRVQQLTFTLLKYPVYQSLTSMCVGSCLKIKSESLGDKAHGVLCVRVCDMVK